MVVKVKVDLERITCYVENYCLQLLLFRYFHTVHSGAVGYMEVLNFTQNPEM